MDGKAVNWRAEWKSVSTEPGELSVTMHLVQKMLKLSVDSWGNLMIVSTIDY